MTEGVTCFKCGAGVALGDLCLEAMGQQLLDVQQDCIKWRKLAESRLAIIDQKTKALDRFYEAKK